MKDRITFFPKTYEVLSHSFEQRPESGGFRMSAVPGDTIDTVTLYFGGDLKVIEIDKNGGVKEKSGK